MYLILGFFVAHWLLSVFFQTFFLHRYGAHSQFTMSPRWERIFHLATWLTQGTSYLNPRAYAILHREHHAFSDTPRDPHSPHVYTNLITMMWRTKTRYEGLRHHEIEPEPRFAGGTPEWATLDRVADRWPTRAAFAVGYTLFYVAFAPSLIWFALLPFHFLMGPIHGAIVNWCGHKYGYRNFENNDLSRNVLPIDFVTLGELFQNNHHHAGTRPNFAVRWFEIDPAYWVIRTMAAIGVLHLVAEGSGSATTVAAPGHG